MFDQNVNVSNELDHITVATAYSCDTDVCNTLITNHTNSLKIFSLNIRSIYKNLDSLIVLLARLSFVNDIIILTECWLNENKPVPHIDNYVTYFSRKCLNQNDGIVIYVKKSIRCTVVEPNVVGANFLLLSIDPDTYILASYRSPSIRCIDGFLSSLEDVLRPIGTNSNVILIGDINIDIKANNNDIKSAPYLNLLAELGMLPGHTFPTRMHNCLDHIILKTVYPVTICVLESSITDHFPIILDIIMKKCNQNNKNINYNRLDFESCVKQINSTDFSFLTSIFDANEAVSKLVNKLTNLIKCNSKVCRIPSKKRTFKPWISQGLLRCIRHRDKLHKQHKKHPYNLIFETTYKRYRNFCNTLLRKLKIDYEKSLLENAKSVKDSWYAIKTITNYTKQKATAEELINSGKNDIETVNNYFSNIGTQLADAINNSNDSYSTTYNFSVTPTLNSIALIPPDESEIETLITNLKNNCATGWDSIPVQLLKTCKHTLVPIITYLFGLCFEQGVFPDVFKLSLITPVHKSGSRDNVSNYRPISVLTALSKLLEKTLNRRLINFLDHYNTLATTQFGFRSGKCTDDAVSQLTDYVTTKIEENQKCLGVFLDLAKAFDTVSIPTLVNKLERIGIRGGALAIFKDFLSNRRQQVKIGDCISSSNNVVYGVPQGSVLGPSLFLIYINDLCLQQLLQGKIFSYADDTAIIFYGETWEEVQSIASEGLHRISRWLRDNLLTLNISKTTYLQFAFAKSKPPDVNIRIHSCDYQHNNNCSCLPITRSTTVKYLGIILDDKLSWHPHIELITARTRKLIWIFKKLRHVADMALLRTVYFALVQSIIGYCVGVWGGACKTHLIQLERAQRSLLKVMAFKKFRYPTEALYHECQILTVRQLYISHLLIKQHKITPYNEEYKKRRVIKNVCVLPKCRTATARRQHGYRSSYLYNKVNKMINIYPLTCSESKDKIKSYLLKLSYEQTEALLSN